MVEPFLHPSPDQLSAFTLGQLPPAETEKVEQHVSECGPCCETMLGLASDDTFVGLLREAGMGSETLSNATAQSALNGSNADSIPAPLKDHTRYEIEQLVGKGGMGHVYKARHRMMDRAVALKVIHREWVQKQEAIDRFRREVKTAASLDHPNIVTAHDAEQAEDLHFLVMEYVDGVDLSERVKDNGRLPIADACDFVRQAAEGLQYAHDLGMVHRDIKPHNLIVTNDNVVKILDFGLASLVPQSTSEDELSEDANGNLTIAGAIMGTPDFISPEQAQDAHNVDGRSDVYSLGMTLYFLLTGRVPFVAGSATEKLRLHAESEPPALASLRSDVPESLTKLVAKMTAKNPVDRFQSPSEVAVELKSLLGGMQRPSQALTSATKRKVGNIIFSGGLALIALFVIGTAYGLFSGFFSRTQSETVTGPLSEVDSYVRSIMASPHDLVFLNLSKIGIDNNYVSLKPIANGILMDFPAIDGDRYSRRQGKYVEQLKQAADSLSLPCVEESQVKKDGVIAGVHFKFSITGEPNQVVDSVRKLLAQAFAVGAKEECQFVFQNLPASSTSIIGSGPKQVSKAEFIAEYKRGERVYFGEVNNWIYLIPRERRNEKQFQRNADVWFTKISALPPGFAATLRLGTDAVRQPLAASEQAQVAELRLITNGSEGTEHGDTTVHSWNLTGRDVEKMTVKLHVAQDGKASVVQQFDFTKVKEVCTSRIRLVIGDVTTTGHQRTLTATLDVAAQGMAAQGESKQSGVLPVAIEAPFSTGRAPAASELPRIRSGRSHLLFAKAYWKGDLSYQDSIKGMVDGSKRGGTFLYVTIEWQPVSDP